MFLYENVKVRTFKYNKNVYFIVKKILVIDDEEDIRTSIKDVLEKEGFSVEGAQSGMVGLSLLEKEKFDMIILDVMMPQMSGWDVFTQIIKSKSEYKNRIIFLSVVEVSEDRKQQLVSEGAADYLTKPFDIKDLIVVVKGVLK